MQSSFSPLDMISLTCSIEMRHRTAPSELTTRSASSSQRWLASISRLTLRTGSKSLGYLAASTASCWRTENSLTGRGSTFVLEASLESFFLIGVGETRPVVEEEGSSPSVFPTLSTLKNLKTSRQNLLKSCFLVWKALRESHCEEPTRGAKRRVRMRERSDDRASI